MLEVTEKRLADTQRVQAKLEEWLSIFIGRFGSK